MPQPQAVGPLPGGSWTRAATAQKACERSSQREPQNGAKSTEKDLLFFAHRIQLHIALSKATNKLKTVVM